MTIVINQADNILKVLKLSFFPSPGWWAYLALAGTAAITTRLLWDRLPRSLLASLELCSRTSTQLDQWALDGYFRTMLKVPHT